MNIKAEINKKIFNLSVERINSYVKILLPCLFLGLVTPASADVDADMDLVSVTLDNDLFVGEDNGYTNGLYFSAFDGQRADKSDKSIYIPEHGFWVSPLMWSMSDENLIGAANAYMIAQTMATPSDIDIVVPDLRELPYAALLALTNSYITVTKHHADRVSTVVGVVGPVALGEETQKLVHEIIGADEPMGWDTQLKNEVVFKFARSRVWRTWVSDSSSFDLLTIANLGVGTIKSGIDAGITLRYGTDLLRSYASTLFTGSRTINPVASDGNWYLYADLQGGYIFNQIFTDGNTYVDSRSIDYDPEYLAVALGFAYSWEDTSLTFAIKDNNVLDGGDGGDEAAVTSRYGTLTYAWHL